MTWWHRHRPDTRQRNRVFVHEVCRCGLTRVSWLDRGLPWWRSSWADGEDVARQLRRVASEAVK